MSIARHRRLRLTPSLRAALRETRLTPEMLVAPVFVTDAPALAGPVAGLPGVERLLVENVVPAMRRIAAVGIRSVMLFGVPGTKTADGQAAWLPEGPVSRALRAIRDAGVDVTLIADVCLCQYRADGQCGVGAHGSIDNDASLEVIARIGASYADAGATLVAPSGMLDGGVAALRTALDAAGHSYVGIMAYTAKHASGLYTPFRAAAHSYAPGADRRTQQIDPANAREALREADADVMEGADILLVKPALTNLDTLVRLRTKYPTTPLAAFQVSGEHAMLARTGADGVFDEQVVSLEILTAIARAGADLIVTYRAEAAAASIASGALA